MAEYPPNSKNPVPEVPKDDQPKIEPVVTGTVSRRKTPLSKKFKETFIGGDAKSVGTYLLTEIIVPTIKDTVADIVSHGIEQMVFGGNRSSVRRGATTRATGAAYTAYNRVTQAVKADPRVSISRQGRAMHDFDEIILGSRVEAEEVIDRLIDRIGKYEQASVADLYELVGITPKYTDDRWGWQEFHGMGVEYVRSGYLLKLPQPVALKEA